MVQEKDDMVIVDETSPEQVAVEAKIASGQKPDAEPEAPVEKAPEPVVETPVAEAPTPPAPPTVEAVKPVQQARVFTEEQVRQMQSSWDRQIAQANRVAAEHQKRLQEFDLNTAVEAHLRTQEKQLEPTLGAEEARRVVRSPDNERAVKESFSDRQELKTMKEREAQLVQEQELQAKSTIAWRLSQMYGVSDQHAGLLMSVSEPAHMEALAKTLGNQARASVRTQVPVETHKTRLESPTPSSPGVESFDRRLERINQTPSSEWSDADWEFMRTGRTR